MPNVAHGLQEPEKYLPERFMEGTPEAAAKPAHGYLPFGDGTRACIGLRFARMEVSLRDQSPIPNCTDRNVQPIPGKMAKRNDTPGNAQIPIARSGHQQAYCTLPYESNIQVFWHHNCRALGLPRASGILKPFLCPTTALRTDACIAGKADASQAISAVHLRVAAWTGGPALAGDHHIVCCQWRVCQGNPQMMGFNATPLPLISKEMSVIA